MNIILRRLFSKDWNIKYVPPTGDEEKRVGSYYCQFGHGHIGTNEAIDCERHFRESLCLHDWGDWREIQKRDNLEFSHCGGLGGRDRVHKKYLIFVQSRQCKKCNLRDYSTKNIFLGEVLL